MDHTADVIGGLADHRETRRAVGALQGTVEDLGLAVDHLATFTVSPDLNGYSPERSRALFRRVEDFQANPPPADWDGAWRLDQK